MKHKVVVFFLIIVFLLVGCMDLSKNDVGENNTLSNNFEETISKTDTANSEMPELDTIIKGDEELLQETIDETYSIVTKTFIQGEVNVKYPQIQGLGDNDRNRQLIRS